MSKQVAEQSNAFSIFWLKKNGYLHKDNDYHYGGINWTYGYSENKSSISFTINKENFGTPEERAYINLNYTNTNRHTDEKESMNYKVELATTSCNYGNKRYWFICPLNKNGKYCGRRIGVLFNIGKWFGCRHCGEIAYAKQMEGGKYRWNGVSVPDIERAEKEVKRYYYKGKPTRKYKRLIRLNEKFNYGLFMMTSKLDKNFANKYGNKV